MNFQSKIDVCLYIVLYYCQRWKFSVTTTVNSLEWHKAIAMEHVLECYQKEIGTDIDLNKSKEYLEANKAK